MNIAVVGQHDIAGAELVSPSLHDIVHVSGDENKYFVKGMLMEIDSEGVHIPIMVIFIETFCHNLPGGKFIYIHIP